MSKLLRGVLSIGTLGVMAFGYWSGARAQEQVGAGLVSVQAQEVTGVIDAIDSTSVTIDGTLYQITDQTEQDGGLQVGDTATIEFITNDDGTLTVTELSSESELESEDADQQETADVDEDDQEEDLDEDQGQDESVQDAGQNQGSNDGSEQESESSGADD